MTDADVWADAPGVERVMVDTNVLLAATDTSRHRHDAAVRLLNEDRRALSASPQNVREYLAVATRPIELNGLGLSSVDAVANLGELLEGMDLVEEDADSADRLTEMVGAGLAIGEQVHDANIVAVAMACGAHTIVTDDRRHFARFADLITIETLDQDGGAVGA